MNESILNNPIPQAWNNYVTQQASGSLEIVPAILYYKATYVTGTTGNVLQFFNATPASDAISNVKQPGILPAGQSMLIQGIRVHLENGIETQDMGAADAIIPSFAQDAFYIQEGVLRMKIGTKPQGPWPIHCLPSGTGAVLNAIAGQGAEAVGLITLQGDIMGAPYGLFPNLLIANLQQFEAEMFWTAALTLSITNKNIWLMFDGQLARPIQ